MFVVVIFNFLQLATVKTSFRTTFHIEVSQLVQLDHQISLSPISPKKINVSWTRIFLDEPSTSLVKRFSSLSIRIKIFHKIMTTERSGSDGYFSRPRSVNWRSLNSEGKSRSNRKSQIKRQGIKADMTKFVMLQVFVNCITCDKG